MKRFHPHAAALAVMAGAALCAAPAWAQMSMPSIPGTGASGGSTGGSMGNAMGSMMGGAGMAMPSLSSASPSNIAGLLQYCVKNNYMGNNAADATSVQQSLLQKATGSTTAPSSDSAFSAGSDGTVDTGNGKTMSLSSSGMQAQLTQKLCDQVLSRGKSLL